MILVSLDDDFSIDDYLAFIRDAYYATAPFIVIIYLVFSRNFMRKSNQAAETAITILETPDTFMRSRFDRNAL